MRSSRAGTESLLLPESFMEDNVHPLLGYCAAVLRSAAGLACACWQCGACTRASDSEYIYVVPVGGTGARDPGPGAYVPPHVPMPAESGGAGAS